MKKVYSSDSFFLIGHLRELLEHHHITCIAKNEFLLGGAGELPPTECWPELWITEDLSRGSSAPVGAAAPSARWIVGLKR
jgi:hypothetical protein